MTATRSAISILAIVTFGAFGPAVLPVRAEVAIEPMVVDLEADAKENLEFAIKVHNNGKTKVELYPVVYDLRSDGRGAIDREAQNKDSSLARWLRIGRGVVELLPGEEKAIDVGVEVGIAATPGLYHAMIAFPAASDRYAAEAMIGQAEVEEVAVNLAVRDDAVVRFELGYFRPRRNSFFEPPIAFDLVLKNIGNRDASARGLVSIYDRRGREAGILKADQKMADLAPDESRQIELVWPERPGWGRYKARLAIEYGDGDVRDLSDTAYFWYFPWKFMAIIGSLMLGTIILAAFVLFRQTRSTHYEPPARDGIIDLSENDE